MALVGIKVPPYIGQHFTSIPVPGVREPVEAYHITMFYLGKDVPLEDVAKAMVVAAEVTRSTAPLSLVTDRVTCFPKNEDGVPIICPIESPELLAVRARLKDAFEASGVSFSNRYPDYKPHMTLAYADEEIEDLPINRFAWAAEELVMWAGDMNDSGVVVTLPLSSIAHRVAARFVAANL